MKSDQDFLRNIFCFQKFEWILFQDDFESELLKKKKSLKVHFLFVCVTQKNFTPSSGKVNRIKFPEFFAELTWMIFLMGLKEAKLCLLAVVNLSQWFLPGWILLLLSWICKLEWVRNNSDCVCGIEIVHWLWPKFELLCDLVWLREFYWGRETFALDQGKVVL